MKLVVVAIGSAGDVHPFLAIGEAAVRCGHRVTLCTSPAFRTLVDACGLEFVALGSAQEYEQAMQDPRLWDPRTSFVTLWDIVSRTLEPLYALLEEHVGDDSVVLGSLWAFAARAMQLKRGLAYLSAQVSPSTLLSAVSPPEHPRFEFVRRLPLPARRALLGWMEHRFVDRLMAPRLDGFLNGIGLPPARRILSNWVHSPAGVLALFPEWFAPAPSDWPANLIFTGFPSFEGPPGQPAELDPELTAFLESGPPPVVVTAGSTSLPGPKFFATAQQTLAKQGLRGVFVGGAATALPPLESDVLHRPNVPFAPLLARAAAIIHHGGIGTVGFALRAGLPQLVVPFAHDQFDNARRVVELGVGMRLTVASSVSTWAAALKELLANPDIHAACLHYQTRAMADSGPVACEAAVHRLEACASSPASAAATASSGGPAFAIPLEC